MSSSAYWKQNLALLRTCYPDLAKQIENGIEDNAWSDNWNVEQTAAEAPTLVYSEGPNLAGILIHSRRDPVREGQRQAEAALVEYAAEADGTAPEIIILLGFGLGYTAEALAKEGSALIIVERRKELFSLALEQRNLAGLLSPGKAIFVMGSDAGSVTAALTMLGPGKQKPLIIKNRALTSLTAEDESWYAEAERRIDTWASKDKINAATLRLFGRRWTRNLAANMEGVLNFPGVKNLEHILKDSGVPVFLAAAGPSLHRMEPFLEEIRRRCVIIAVDTSLRFLLRRGVDPDFAVSVDPQFWNALHLFRLNAPRTALIAESAAYPAVFRNSAFSRVFFCQSLFPMGRFIEDWTDPKGPLGAGGSVATTAWDFARLLDPPSLWISGLDLAFPGYHTHFRGALFEETTHALSGRRCPVETFSVQTMENGVPFNARSAGGGKVLTDKRLSLYAAWFENRFDQFSQSGLINYSLSPDGLAVSGLVNAEPEELLAMSPCRDKIDDMLETLYRRIDDEFNISRKDRTERYTQALTALVRGLEAILDNAVEAAAAVKTVIVTGPASDAIRGSESDKNKIGKVLKKLEKVNGAIAASPVKDAAGFLFPPIAELEKELHETDNLNRYLEFSLLFYRSLSESADFTLRFLKGGRNVNFLKENKK
ncbi:MAG: DUF115 domain-containing protein [Treponema sp.]|nr:DUF115 domain-containing protein [Treponema sp.]